MNDTPWKNPYETAEITARLTHHDRETIERLARERGVTIDMLLSFAVMTYEEAETYRRDTGDLLPWEKDRKAAGLGVLD